MRNSVAKSLKQILSDKADHSVYRQKFQIEAEITGNLEHPGIVPVYGLVWDRRTALLCDAARSRR